MEAESRGFLTCQDQSSRHSPSDVVSGFRADYTQNENHVCKYVQGRRPSSVWMALLGNMVISCLSSGILWFCFDRLVIVCSVPKPGLDE